MQLHCFCCQANLNNIDLMMALGYDFRHAIGLLHLWLKQVQTRQSRQRK